MKSLFDLAVNVFVKNVSLLSAFMNAIPPVLYELLLKASIETDRILSVRYLFLNWPLRQLSLVNFSAFKEEHALVLARSLESGYNTLDEVDLTGCNVGIQGTTLLLMLATGKQLSKVTEYCSNKNISPKNVVDKGKHLSNKLSITTDCYVDQSNYYLFLDAVKEELWNERVHDIFVSYIHAISLGFPRIKKILKEMGKTQAKSVIGFNMTMNNLLCGNSVWHNPSLAPVVNKQIQNCSYFERFPNVQYLNLSNNFFGFHHILKHITSFLTILVLNECKLTSKNFVEMGKAASIKKLNHLDVAHNLLCEFEFGFIEFLHICRGTLRYLNLENNLLKNESRILELLAAPFAIETLNIKGNRFSLDAQKLLYRKDNLLIIRGYSAEVNFKSGLKT